MPGICGAYAIIKYNLYMQCIVLAYAWPIHFTYFIFILKNFSSLIYYPLKYCFCILYKVNCAIISTWYI